MKHNESSETGKDLRKKERYMLQMHKFAVNLTEDDEIG